MSSYILYITGVKQVSTFEYLHSNGANWLYIMQKILPEQVAVESKNPFMENPIMPSTWFGPLPTF